MKRRTFFKTTAAAGAAATAAPAIWSEAKAQARNETLLIVTESPPNTMDIHGVGANRPGYEASWNTHDRLITYGVKKDANGNDHYDYTKLEPELADDWDVDADMSVTFKLRKDAKFHDGTPVTAKDVKWSFDRAVTVGGFPTFQMTAGSLEKPEQFVVVDDHTFRVDFLRAGQADHARHRRAGAGDHQFRAVQEARDRDGSVGDGMAARTTTPAAAPTRSRAGSPGQEVVYRALRRLEERAAAQGPAGDLAHDPVGRQPPRAARARRRRHLVRPAAQGFRRAGKTSPKLTVVGTPIENALIYLGMNVNQTPFDNVKVRQAVAYAIPYQKIMDAVMFGQASRCSAAPTTSSRAPYWPQKDALQDRHRQGQGADGRGGLSPTASRRRCRSTWASPAPTSRSPSWCRRAWRRSASRPRSTRSRAPTGAASF